MKTKNLTILIIAIVIIAALAVFLFLNKNSATKILTPSQNTSTSVQDKQITDNTKPFVIKITYPYIAGLDDFNAKSKAIVDKELSDFKTNSLANDEAVKKVDPTDYAKYPREYDLTIGYDKGEIDNNIVSTIFNVYNFEGGAHGASYFITLNYNPKTKQEITLAELFPGDKNYLQTISTYCTADLTKQLTKALGSLDGTFLTDGAGPNADNFQFFLINKNNIIFYFPQYQVAYGAAGSFTVTMPR